MNSDATMLATLRDEGPVHLSEPLHTIVLVLVNFVLLAVVGAATTLLYARTG